jgi:hydroxymethylglutaryl-CoA lyase
MGGLGGCPFAQDELVGNIPTEEVFGALERRNIKPPIESSLTALTQMNDAISAEFAVATAER